MYTGLYPARFLVFFILFSAVFYAVPAQVDHVGDKTFYVTVEGHPLKIPYYANASLTGTLEGVNRAVFVIHGAGRNADEYYADMVTAAGLRPDETDSTLIIAPQFLTEDDIVANHLDSEYLYWSSGGWKSGSNSKDNDDHPRPARIPSYAVLDSMMSRVAAICPHLRAVVFAGHSAGGQLANRYAATSPLPDQLCERYRLPVRFVVANPSSYLYFDGKRREEGSVDRFSVPQTSCTDYNEWKYGLEDLYTYPAAAGKDSIRNMYRRREVVYLLGGEDDDPYAPSLDLSCAAELQGKHRLERGTVYFNYLLQYYGEGIREPQSLDTIPGVGHDHAAMFSSETGLYWLFENEQFFFDGLPSGVRMKRTDPAMHVFPVPAADVIWLETPGGNGRVTVYDLQGRKVLSAVANASLFRMNISVLKDGMYILEYRSGNRRARQIIIRSGDGAAL